MIWNRILGAAVLSLALIANSLLASEADDKDDELEGGTIGTGILGEITGFGSIHIGGVDIELPEGARVHSTLGDEPVSRLELGETVVVHALRSDAGIIAQTVRNYHPLIGPVEAVSSDTIRVLGLQLDVSDLELPDVAPQDWVAVSGLWRGETLVVSHLRPIEPQDVVVVSGSYTLVGAGVQKVGPFQLDVPTLRNASVGDHLQVVGRLTGEGRRITPEEITVGLFPPDLSNLFVEGYMSEPDSEGTYFIFGSGVVFQSDDLQMAVPRERSLFCVQIERDARFEQVRSLDLPQSERRRVLEGLRGNAPFPCNP